MTAGLAGPLDASLGLASSLPTSLTLAAADPVMLTSAVKPLVFAATMIAWGWIVSRFDKDAEFFHLKRNLFNLVQVLCGVLGFGLMLIIPLFVVGWPLGVIVLIGGVVAYVMHHNATLPEREQWKLSWDTVKNFQQKRQLEHAQRAAKLKLLTKDEAELPVPGPTDPAFPAHMLLQDLLMWAVPRNAEQVDVQVQGEQVAAVVRIDGVKFRQEDPDQKTAILLMDYLKQAAKLDIEDRRKKQTGIVNFSAGEHGKNKLEVTTTGSSRGLSITMVLNPEAVMEQKLDDLGLNPHQLKQAHRLVGETSGVVLITGPSRSGVTTTLYSLLGAHDPYTTSVVTLEQSVRFELEGVKHNQVPESIETEQFNRRLAAILRGEPNVLLIDRLSDPSTAKLAAESAGTVRFYFPIAARSIGDATRKWTKVIGGAKDAADSLAAVFNQRLIRKLCPTCRVAYQPDAAALKRLNIPKDSASELYKASGKVVVGNKEKTCPACLGIGYRGRTAIFEVIVVDEQGVARQYIANQDTDKLKAYMRKNGLPTLQEAALAKVVSGETDIREIQRVLGEKE